MKPAGKKSLPAAWLALVPGLAIGVLLGWMAPGSEADTSVHSADTAWRHTPEPEHEADAVTAHVGGVSDSKVRRFIFERSRLDCLIHNAYKLKLDLTAFDEGRAISTTDTTFGILREVLSVTPREELDLRALLTRNAAAVRAYEKAHAKILVTEPGHIIIDMPSLKPIQQEMGSDIEHGLRAILGDDRAEMFNAISKPASIVGLNDDPLSKPGKVEFAPSDYRSYLKVTMQGDKMPYLTSIPADTEKQWISLMRSELFTRYNHLLSNAEQEAYIHAVNPFESPANK